LHPNYLLKFFSNNERQASFLLKAHFPKQQVVIELITTTRENVKVLFLAIYLQLGTKPKIN